MTGPTSPPRLGELDALRGIAALIVVLFHYTWKMPDIMPAARTIGWGLAWGAYGVHLFFAISGFVILMTLERTRNAADFAVSRFARLYPAYWAAVALTTVGTMIAAPSLAQPPGVVLVNLTMLQGFFYLPAVDGVYWSLTVELSFYACMLALWRLRLLGRIETVLLCWLALKPLFGLVDFMPYRLGLILVADTIPFFALGMAAYRVHIGVRRWSQQWPVVLAGLAALLIVDGVQDALVYAIVAGIFWSMTMGWLVRLNHPVLLWLGGISYTLYLLHQNLGYALIAALENAGAPPWLALCLTVAAALGLAHLVCEYVERPALHGIRQWWKRRTTPALA